MQTEKTDFYACRKYNILWYLDQILTGGQREAAIDELPLVIQTSASQFLRYVYAKHGQPIEITAVKLLKIAEYLGQQSQTKGITVEDLINKQEDGQTAQGKIT